MKKSIRIAVTAVVVLAVVAGLGWVVNKRFKDKLLAMGKFGKKPPAAREISIPVMVTRAKSGRIADSLVLNGGVAAKSEVNLFSNVPGKVKEILVREGAEVKKGEVLARVDRSETGLTYALAPVESTIDGVVNEVFVEVGASVTPAQPIFQVIDVEEVEVQTFIPERYVSRVRVGMGVEVSLIAHPGRVFKGAVTRLAPAIDPLSRTREARILMDNRGRLLKPGMFGDVKIIMNERANAVLIPAAAIVDRDGRSLVFLVDGEGKAVEVEPAVDIVEGERLSVSSGVKPGDTVVLIGQQNLNAGDKVTIAEVRE